MPKIAITTTTFGQYNKSPLNLLKKARLGIALNPCGRKLEKGEIIKMCKDSIGIISGTELLDADVIGKLDNLRVISRCGSGLSNVDVGAAKRAGIEVFNTPDAPTLAVSELTVALILNILRKINFMHISIKNNKWEKLMGNILSDKKVGIIGFGRIGRKVAELLSSFGCEIAYADPYVEDGIMDLNRLSMSRLLRWADIISIHVSGKDRLIGKNEIRMMKKGGWLINVSRGGVVDEEALYQALKEGYLSGAALDVFEQEPYKGPLKKLGNIILTPHIGSYAKEARIKMEMQAVENLLKGLGCKIF